MPITDQTDIQHLLSIKSFALNPDPRVTAAIAAAQAAVEEQAGFLFDARTGIVSYLEGDGTNKLRLPVFPVSGITSVVEDGVTLTDGVDFVWRASGTLTLLSGIWSTVPQDIVVTYDTGWADKDAAPNALRWLVARVAARFWTEGLAFAEAGSSGVKQETIDGYSVTYADSIGTPAGLNHDEMLSARRWRRTMRSVVVS